MLNFTLLFASDFEQARGEIETLGGRVTQKLTDQVFEASLPDGLDATTLEKSSNSAPAGLDDISRLMAAAWTSGQAKAKLTGAAGGAADGIPWDTEGFLPPRHAGNDPALREPGQKKAPTSTGTPTSLYLTGSVAVGLIVVSGTSADLKFSEAEQTKVIAEVMEGLRFLAGAEPAANLTFIYSVQFVTVNAAPPSSCPSYEACEKVWRDPALQSLGYPTGDAGCDAYAARLRQQTGSDWSYIGFFTKYPLFNFAYAVGTRICMQYSNDGWKPDRINQVFAHETCHIFGADDEYGGCGCGVSGYFNIPNRNCHNCTTDQVDCLMNENTLSLCPWSRGQIGWSSWAQIPGRLSNVSCASDGSVWGVAGNGNIYKYSSSSNSWRQIPGALTRISAASATSVWGVAHNGNIYRLGPNGETWQQVPGKLIDVDVAADGTVWGVAYNGNIYRYVPASNTWQQIPGALRRVSVGSAGFVWGLAGNGNIYRYLPASNSWQQVDGLLAEIGAAADGTVWGVSGNDNIYKYAGGWQQVAGRLNQISTGGSKIIWGVAYNDQIYQRLVGAT